MSLRICVGRGLVATGLLLAAGLANAATIPATTETGDFVLSVADDITQSGPLVVGGTTTISGDSVTLDQSGNDFNAAAANMFVATDGLIVTDASGLRGSFSAGNSAGITSSGTLVIDALTVTGSALITASDGGGDFFDVIVRNAQNLSVSGTLSILAESILFDFSDGGPADLGRLNVGLLALTPNIDDLRDNTVAATGISVTSSNVAVIPLPATLWLALSGIAALAALAFGARRHGKNRKVAVA